MMPFYQTGGFDYPVAMLLATLLGLAFGFVLERAGFGRATVLVAQFHGTDMRVLKVMFTAIATTGIGIALLSGVGALDLSKLVIPETFLWPQIVGGVLLGAGFVVSGYCPGTGVVASASGYVDALYGLGGVAVGSLLFGFVYPLLEGFYGAGAMGKVTLPEVLGISWSVVALAVALIAIASFVLAERLERYYAARAAIAPPTDSPRVRNRTLGTLAAVGAGTLLTLALPDPTVAPAERSPRLASIDAIELARGLADQPDSFYLVDLRSPTLCQAKTLPGAMCVPGDDLAASFVGKLPATRTLVLFGDTELPYLPASLGTYAGTVRALSGGLQAFHSAVLTAPTAPSEPGAKALSDFRLRAALHARFTGTTTRIDAPSPTVKPVSRATKKGGGC